MEELSNKRFFSIIINLAILVILASIDSTSVLTFIPIIKENYLTEGKELWVSISYLLTATSFLPLYGRLYVLFGRRVVFFVAQFIFLLGSICCASVNNLNALLVFRAISGIGGGGLVSLSSIIVAGNFIILILLDLTPPENRAKYLGIFGALYGLSNIVGPFIGGLFYHKDIWKLFFYMNVPIGSISSCILLYVLPSSLDFRFSQSRRKIMNLDYLGSLVIILGTTLILLAINSGIKYYKWPLAAVIPLITSGLVCLLIILPLIEVYLAKDPIIPLSVLNRNVSFAIISSFFLGYIMYTNIYYLPYYFHYALGDNIIITGLEIFPYLISTALFSIFAGLTISYFGFLSSLIWSSGAIAIIGTGLMTLLDMKSSLGAQIGYQMIIGCSIGIGIQTLLLKAELSSKLNNIATTVVLISFSRQLGGLFGLAIHGSILNDFVNDTLLKQVGMDKRNYLNDHKDNLGSLSKKDSDIMHQAYSDGIHYLYVYLIPFASAWFLSSLFLRRVSVRNHSH